VLEFNVNIVHFVSVILVNNDIQGLPFLLCCFSSLFVCLLKSVHKPDCGKKAPKLGSWELKHQEKKDSTTNESGKAIQQESNSEQVCVMRNNSSFGLHISKKKNKQRTTMCQLAQRSNQHDAQTRKVWWDHAKKRKKKTTKQMFSVLKSSFESSLL